MAILRSLYAWWLRRPAQVKVWAVGIGLVVVFIDGWVRLRDQEWQGSRYIISRRALAPGINLAFQDLTVRLAKRGEDVGPGVFTDQEVEMLRGAKVLQPLAPGELVTADKVEIVAKRGGIGGEVPKGYRAYLLEAETSVPIVPGDQVDITVIPQNREFAPVTLLENNKVLTARVRDGKLQVALALRPEMIPVVEEARAAGTFRLALRSPEEAGTGAVADTPWTKKKSKSRGVEVISGG